MITPIRFGRRGLRPAAALLSGALLLTGWLQAPELDEALVVLTYHHLTGDSLDYQRAAGFAETVRRASQFDQPDAIAAEVTRLREAVGAADVGREFTVQVRDYVSQYDHDKSEFSISLYEPGHYLPLQVFGEEYRLVFANAEAAHAIAMPKEQARDFDARLNRLGRSLTNEIRFKVVGKGDPAGSVSGRVIQAEILGARLLDRDGQVVFTPTFTARPAAMAATDRPAFDPAAADVAGLRVGVKGKDLEATLTRLFGTVSRGGASSASARGMVASLEVNAMGCMKIPGRRVRVGPGSVCVIAYLDGDDVVRMVRVERLFPAFDGDAYRSALVQKYGAVTTTNGGGYGWSLGWGPSMPGAFFNGINALTASIAPEEDAMDLGGNRIADLKLTLQLVDAAWVASHTSK